MKIWKERYLVPNLERTHVMEGYKDICNECENWGTTCESCNVSVPIVTDEYEIKERIIGQIVLCGIPMGIPFKIKT